MKRHKRDEVPVHGLLEDGAPCAADTHSSPQDGLGAWGPCLGCSDLCLVQILVHSVHVFVLSRSEEVCARVTNQLLK